jgi:hypothetical protein
MAVTARAVTPETLGAWVLTCNPRVTAVEPMVAAGRAATHWCVADNYRSRLMQPGHRVLFWVAAHPRRGFWGDGRLTGAPGPLDGRLKVATDIALFDTPLTAAELRDLPGVRDMELFRSPQQSNPSWVTRTQLASLEPLLAAAERFASRHF